MRSFVKSFLVVCVGFVCIQNIVAHEDIPINENLLKYYDHELFKWESNGFGDLKLNYQNTTSSITFGIPSIMADALKKYPDTEQYYDSYHRKNVTGNILFWGGFSVIMGGVIATPFLLSEKSYEPTHPIVLGVMFGGLITELIGTLILPSGYGSLFNSVNLYNRHKMGEYAQ
jgi:hypothetical protein